MKKDLETIYWIFLSEALGYASSKTKKLVKIYSSVFDFFNLGFNEWKLSGIFNEKELIRLKNTKLEKSEKILKVCKDYDYTVLTYNSEEYPKRLKEINNPPAVLYVKGNLPKIDDEILIAIVGTREPSVYGKNVAFNFGYNLGVEGVIVVSGGALGIDSAAQHGAIMAGGKVISVLGCGFNCRYPIKNEKLRESTAKNGALISEYPPNVPAIPRNFPIRNRIISALSLGILVVEAGEKSGALITADFAKKQNKDIFAIPGNINSNYSIGPNKLIQNGAKLVTKVEDILYKYKASFLHTEEYKKDLLVDKKLNGSNYRKMEVILENENSVNNLGKNKLKNLNLISYQNNKELSKLSKNSLLVYNQLSDGPLTLDDLVLKTDLNISEVIEITTELEILGLIKSIPGGMYQKN